LWYRFQDEEAEERNLTERVISMDLGALLMAMAMEFAVVHVRIGDEKL